MSLLCRLRIWHRWGAWGEPEVMRIMTRSSFGIPISDEFAYVQQRQCELCGVVQTRPMK